MNGGFDLPFSPFDPQRNIGTVSQVGPSSAKVNLPQAGKRADRWNINPSSGRLVAERSGASIGIGDIVTVQVTSVDLASRQLDLLITTLPVPPEAVTAEPHSTRERKSRKNASKKQKSSSGGRSKGKGKSSKRSR